MRLGSSFASTPCDLPTSLEDRGEIATLLWVVQPGERAKINEKIKFVVSVDGFPQLCLDLSIFNY